MKNPSTGRDFDRMKLRNDIQQISLVNNDRRNVSSQMDNYPNSNSMHVTLDMKTHLSKRISNIDQKQTIEQFQSRDFPPWDNKNQPYRAGGIKLGSLKRPSGVGMPSNASNIVSTQMNTNYNS